MASVFFSYSHKDEDLRDRLEVHLAMLKNEGSIETWHDRRIEAGEDFAGRIGNELERADLILLLVSPDFLASKYCYDVETARAIERHHAGEARVVPVILRPCDWHSAPFGKLQAVPKDGKPITTCPDLDEAFLEVVKAIRSALGSNESEKLRSITSTEDASHITTGTRSSNLRLKKEFSDADRDRFLNEAFEYMATFFDNSLNELSARNTQIESFFRRVDANRFTATVYRNGNAVSSCRISLGGALGKGIFFSEGEDRGSNSFNESLSVEFDDQSLFLRPMGMGRYGDEQDAHLTFEGASEYYWGRFIRPLQ